MIDDLTNFDVSNLGKVGSEKLLLEVNIDVDHLNDWLSCNAPHVTNILRQNGALLLRSLPIQGSKKLERVLTILFGDELLEYNYRSTPRTKMRGRIYTSSEYHPEETIGLHNENAYSNAWAMNIGFYCVKPSDTGGATPIASSQKVYASIPNAIREKFENRQLLYVRNYGEIDLPWSEVFQTEDREEVEKYCTNNKIQFEWIGNHGLRTKQSANAAYSHPVTGEKLWFNQAHLFHVSSFSNVVSESLLNTFKKEDLPRNVYYGDGGDIEVEALEHIRNAYQKNMIAFDWREGDLLLLDNMRYSHGRQPYVGSRRILVGMTTAINADQLEPLGAKKALTTETT